MMKKASGKLNLGDSFIRKGSHQTRLTRKDIDYYESRRNKVSISDENINISFEENKISHTFLINKKNIKNFDKERSWDLIKIKNQISQNEVTNPLHYLDPNTIKLNRYKEELESYYEQETNAIKFNFYIHNKNSQFLKNVSIKIIIEKN